MNPPLETRPGTWLALLALSVCSGLAQTVPAAGSNSGTQNPTKEDGKEEPPIVVLSPFIVDSTKDEGYRATATLAGSRINTPLKDVAAPITVLTKEFIADLGAVDINSVMGYVANGEGTGSFTNTATVLGNPTDEIVQNPTAATRMRGLSAPDLTRDYFYTIGTALGFDTYNLDQITVNRGPNSVLAGLGSPAGIVNYSPQLAGLSKSSGEATVRFGSWGDKRAALNSNILAKKDVLAFRIATVWANKGYKQKPSYNKDRRFYLAATYRPWTKTTIRASFEDVSVKWNLPGNLTPVDAVSQWVNYGKPTASPPSTSTTYSFPTFDGAGQTLIYNAGKSLEGVRPTNKPYGYTFAPVNTGNVAIWVPPHLNHNRYIDLQNKNINAQLADKDFSSFTASIDQEITPDFFANVAYFRESFSDDNTVLYRPQYTILNIDVNLTLPQGGANPHFGELYMDQRGLDNRRINDNSNEVMRATLTYDLDLKQHNRWLGKWRATAFAEDRETETNSKGYTTNANFQGTQSQINARFYLGGNLTTPATTTPVYQGLVNSVANDYFDSASSSWKKGTISSFYAQGANNKQLTKLGTTAAVIQGYLWDDRIVGLYGVRRDVNKSATLTRSGQPVDPSTPYGPFSEVKATTKSYGLVVHALPSLSLHYNRSENFVPNAGSIDLLGNATPSPTGNGKDYGFSLQFFGDKLNIKYNHFKLDAKDGPPDFNASFVGWWLFPWFDRAVMPIFANTAGVTTYKQGIQQGLIEGDPRLEKGYTANNVSEGDELEFTYNINKNWRVMGSVSKQDAKQSGVATNLTSMIESRIAYYKSLNLWNGPIAGDPWGGYGTAEQSFGIWVLPQYIGYKATDGKPSQQIAKYRGSLMTNYYATEGVLKGWNFGGGLRYIDKAVIGNPAILNSSGAVIGLDTSNPYTAGAYIGVDGWVGYTMKLSDRYSLSFSLHGYDLQEGGHFQPIYANSDGAHSVYRIVQPRSFYFTTRLEF